MNPNIDRMKDLMLEHCNFSDETLSFLLTYAKRIIQEKQYPNNDVFIDVFDRTESKAYVVFHRPNLNRESLYKNDIVGEVALLSNEPGVLRTLQTNLVSNGLHGISQEGRAIVQKVFPIRESEEVIATLIVESSPEEKSLASSVAQVSAFTFKKNLSELYDQLDQSVLLYEKTGQLIWANKLAHKLYQKLGYHDELESLDYDNTSLDHTNLEYLLYLFTVKKEVNQTSQTKYLDYYYSIKKIWLKDSERILISIWDITQSRIQEEDIRKKSLLIQEIHHRVKNNLQSIVSLLQLQERRAKDNEAKKVLRESSSRILAIATTHQVLSQHFDDSVSFKEVLDNLISNLRRTLVSPIEIEIEQQVTEDISLDSNQLVTLSLIINELISNAYEHAFEHRQKGRIIISMTRSSHQVELIVKDDGNGYDTENTKKDLGLKIVSMYVNENLHGHLEVTSGKDGTINKIQFINEDK